MSLTKVHDSLDKNAQLKAPHKRRFELLPWVALIAGIYVIALVLQVLITNDSWNWSLVWSYMFSDRVLLGVFNTIFLTVLSLSIGILLGLFTCVARLSKNPILRIAAYAYVWLTRATPMLVILLLIYFLGALTPTLGVGLPFLGSIVEWPTNDIITPFTTAVSGLAIYLGGKTAEIFRSGVVSVQAGQYEAVRSLGLSPWTAATRVIGPQAFRVTIPPLSNEVVTMFKSTSLVSLIGYVELLTTAQQLYSVNFYPIPMLTVASIWYLALTSVLMIGQARLETKLGQGY